MIEIYLANSLTFDYSKFKDKKIDIIFTNPPAFNPDKILFANNIDQHVSRMLTWFRNLMEQLNISLAFIHLTTGKFIRMKPGHEKIISFAIIEERYKTSNWLTISGRDIYAFFSRYISEPSGKTLLDPFCGTGRILNVVRSLGMNGIGIELDRNELNLASECFGVAIGEIK